MINGVLVVLIVVIIGIALGYIYKEKKKGNHCIGCPYAKNCNKDCSFGGDC